jgi:hypothetical protein
MPFESATAHASSVLFIDESDAVFENGEELGRYRLPADYVGRSGEWQRRPHVRDDECHGARLSAACIAVVRAR